MPLYEPPVKLVTPKLITPRVRARDRLAPTASRRASLGGWVRWGLIDRAGREVQGGEQHNLILNTMLDDIATNTINGGISLFSSYLSHFAVGTGSTEPAVTDTALVSELARTTTQTLNTQTRTANGVYELELEREFDFGDANGNLTEFGFARGVSADMLVRELFRDGGGNAVTVTKTSDYKLRIKYTLTITLTPVTATAASFTITGIGAINGDIAFIGTNNPASSPADLLVFAKTARGQVGSSASVQAYLRDSPITGYTTDTAPFVSSPQASTLVASTYTPGSYERSISSVQWGTAQGNVSGVRCIAVQSNNQAGSEVGFAINIDAGDAFTKDNEHILTMTDLITVSWARGT